jgi:hypothetical protein
MAGISSMHEAHHVAQKLIKTTDPVPIGINEFEIVRYAANLSGLWTLKRLYRKNSRHNSYDDDEQKNNGFRFHC